jgi:chromosome segregation ATPase
MAPRIPETIDPAELARQLHEQGVLLQRLMQNFERQAREGLTRDPALMQWAERATGSAGENRDGAADALALVKARDQLRAQVTERRAQFGAIAQKVAEAKRVIESPWTSRDETKAAQERLTVLQRDHDQERTLIKIFENRLEKAELELADALHRESLPSKLAPPGDSDKPRRS